MVFLYLFTKSSGESVGVTRLFFAPQLVIKIKIEPNFIMRGTLLPIKQMDLVKEVEEKFEYRVRNIPVVAEEELYAGKICAALSRQHPRDFFDISHSPRVPR